MKKEYINTRDKIVGSPPIFMNPEHAKDLGEEFFEWCKETKRFPTVTGFAVFLKTDRQSVWAYTKIEGYKTILKNIKDRIYDEKLQAGYRGDLNTTVFIFDCVNNHDMFNTRSENKNDQKHSGSVEVTGIQVEFVKS